MSRYSGYAGYAGYEGLVILSSTAFQGPVHIVRQTISHNETLIFPYHTYEGLSRALKKQGTKKDNQYLYRYNKPYILAIKVWQICGYKGLKVCYE
jgi:hypothetical protein